MKSKKPLTDEALEAFESSLDVAAELRKSVKEMVAKKGTKVEISPVVSARIGKLSSTCVAHNRQNSL